MDWRYNTIWFDQINEEDQITWDFDRKMTGPLNLTNQRYLLTRKYKMKGDLSFDALPASDKLLYLNLVSSNIKDFQTIEKFPVLKRLELEYCLKLESDSGIASLKNSIEILHINQSKKLSSIDEISQLSGLNRLEYPKRGRS